MSMASRLTRPLRTRVGALVEGLRTEFVDEIVNEDEAECIARGLLAQFDMSDLMTPDASMEDAFAAMAADCVDPEKHDQLGL